MGGDKQWYTCWMHKHTHTYTCTNIYMCALVCVCVYACHVWDIHWIDWETPQETFRKLDCKSRFKLGTVRTQVRYCSTEPACSVWERTALCWPLYDYLLSYLYRCNIELFLFSEIFVFEACSVKKHVCTFQTSVRCCSNHVSWNY